MRIPAGEIVPEEAIKLLGLNIENDAQVAFVMGLIDGRAARQESKRISLYRMIDQHGWYGRKLWTVFDRQCGQNIERFFNLLLSVETQHVR